MKNPMARGLTTVLLFASLGLVSIVTGDQLVSAWERNHLSRDVLVWEMTDWDMRTAWKTLAPRFAKAWQDGVVGGSPSLVLLRHQWKRRAVVEEFLEQAETAASAGYFERALELCMEGRRQLPRSLPLVMCQDQAYSHFNMQDAIAALHRDLLSWQPEFPVKWEASDTGWQLEGYDILAPDQPALSQWLEVILYWTRLDISDELVRIRERRVGEWTEYQLSNRVWQVGFLKNRVRDSGFEQMDTWDVRQLAAWPVRNYIFDDTEFQLVPSMRYGITGKAMRVVAIPSNGSVNKAWTYSVPVEPCRFYLLGAWVRRVSADGSVQLLYRWRIVDNGNSGNRDRTIARAESQEWTYVATMVRAPTDARLLWVWLLIQGRFSAAEWDDVTVLELPGILVHDWNTCSE